SSNAAPSTDSRAPSTCRVVLGWGDTSPNPTSRVNVRSNDVLPTLVCPTTAIVSVLSMPIWRIQNLSPANAITRHGLKPVAAPAERGAKLLHGPDRPQRLGAATTTRFWQFPQSGPSHRSARAYRDREN